MLEFVGAGRVGSGMPRRRPKSKIPASKRRAYRLIRSYATYMREGILSGGAAYNEDQYNIAMAYPDYSDEQFYQLERSVNIDLFGYVKNLYDQFMNDNSGY